MLEIRNINKTFNPGTINEKKALIDVSITLNDGDFCTVIGGNGAGKSTIMNAVAGVWPLDSGMILVDGVDVSGLSEYQRAPYFGRVFQDPMTGTAGDMQIDENMALAARRGQRRTLRWGVTKKEREQYQEYLIMATMKKPKVLLLDEHTAALDPKTASKVLAATDKVVEEHHLTTLMVTHNMRDAIAHGNRLIMMNEGRVALDISGEEKKKLTVEDLLHKFEELSGGNFANDRMLLSK